MALFTDGPLNTSGELQQYENAILDVTSTEKIDITAKAVLAQDEIGTELLLFLDRNSLWDPRVLMRHNIGIQDIVLTEPLKRWHAYKTLAFVYQDAYNNQLNDRYKGKWTQYNQLSRAAAERLFAAGVGIVHQPLAKAPTPIMTTVPMGVTGNSYYARISWVNASGQEGLVSDPVQVVSEDGSAVVISISDFPNGVVLWNVYAGPGPNEIMLQTASPLPTTATWVLPPAGLQSGSSPGDGQAPEWWIVDRHILPRG